MTLYRQKYRIETSRLENWDYAFPGWYFVTICTANRQCWFGKIVNDHFISFKIGRIALAQWQAIPTHYSHVKLDEFVVMPNHLHGIVILEGVHRYTPDLTIPQHVPRGNTLRANTPAKRSLSTIIRSFKAGVSRACRIDGVLEFSWQPRFYDRILTSNASVAPVRDYIINNPRNWAKDEENPYRLSCET